MLDVTCFVSRPRISITGDTNLFIGGYKSGDDTDASVTFGRQRSTDTGTGLPSGSNQRDHPSFGSRARQLLLPASGGIERIGAFKCEVEKEGLEHTIPAIIMADNSKSSVVI